MNSLDALSVKVATGSFCLTLSYNTTHCQKPDDYSEDVLQSLSVWSNSPIHGDGFQKFEADVKIEYGTDAYGAEEANKYCLLLLFYLPDVPV